MKHPKVTLVNSTPDPEKTIYAAWQIMHREPVRPQQIYVKASAGNDGMNDLNQQEDWTIQIHDTDLKEILLAIGNQAHGGVTEMIHFNFLIENVSRAFQQQLTRTRQASYCIQSLRIVRCDDFSDKENYLPFQEEGFHPAVKHTYEMAMDCAQTYYRQLIEEGVKAETARAILPLAIFSPIWMGINLRALIHMLDQRFCVRTQGEFRQVADALREAVREKYPMLAEAFLDKCGCERTQTCSNSSPCGKYPKLGDTKNFKVETDESGKTTTSWE